MLRHIEVYKAVLSGASAFYVDKYGNQGSMCPIIREEDGLIDADLNEPVEIWWKDVVYLEIVKTENGVETHTIYTREV